MIDIIYRGAQMSIDMICKVYSSVATGALFPWGSGTLGNVYTSALPIAQLANSSPDVLALTAVANTPAASSPATLTASVIISPDQNFQVILNSTLREVPLRFDALLQDSGGTGSLFTVS